MLVEDDTAQATAICDLCKGHGYAVDPVKTGVEANEMLLTETYDCIVLDLGLPDSNGEEILLRLRMRSDLTPVLILSGRNQPSERTRLITAGADDFMSKPYYGMELLARISNLTRRRGQSPGPETVIGEVVIRPGERLVTRNGNRVNLTRREYAVLEYLLHRRGKLVIKQDVELSVYGFDFIASNTLEVYISRIRRKLGQDLIETVRGFGYRLKEK
ncbi:response regulator transcription factor [Rhizobium ruizarguesonis]|nr:response regulator transcription factor [Rhizobium ruizarguesonis]